jgi:hypothetical protein
VIAKVAARLCCAESGPRRGAGKGGAGKRLERAAARQPAGEQTCQSIESLSIHGLCSSEELKAPSIRPVLVRPRAMTNVDKSAYPPP